MKFLPSKEQIIPGMIIALLTLVIVNRVGIVRNIVLGAPKA